MPPMTLETGWLDGTPVEDTVLRQFLHNQADLGDLIAAAVGGRHARSPGLALADAGRPRAVPESGRAARAGALGDRRQARSNRRVLRLGHQSGDRAVRMADPGSDRRAAGCSSDIRCSWSGHPRAPVRAPGGRHDCARADAAGLAVAERVVIDGYPLPEAVGTAAATHLRRVDLLGDRAGPGRRTSTGARPRSVPGTSAHGVVNLCLAATLPSARRRGAWESLVWARVDDAPELPAVAFTSDDSRPGFIRMGFLPITRFTLWLRPPA